MTVDELIAELERGKAAGRFEGSDEMSVEGAGTLRRLHGVGVAQMSANHPRSVFVHGLQQPANLRRKENRVADDSITWATRYFRREYLKGPDA